MPKKLLQSTLGANLKLARPIPEPRSPQHLHSPFLTLPRSIRRRIYIFAGLVRLCSIDLNAPLSEDVDSWIQDPDWQEESDWELDEEDVRGRFTSYSSAATDRCPRKWDWYDDCDDCRARYCINCTCDCEQLPIALLFVNRQISAEAMDVLYGENSFCISLAGMYGFRLLLTMGNGSLKRLRKLYVELGKSPRAPLHRLWADPRMKEDEPLNTQFLERVWGGDNVVLRPLKAWRSLLYQLGSAMLPRTLDLEVNLVATDADTVNDFLGLLKNFSGLKSCAVRIGRGNVRLHGFAKTWAGRLNPSIRPFRFLDLPVELQQSVLRFTDLVHPHAIECRLADHRGNEATCCGNCSHSKTCFCVDRQGYSSYCTCQRLDFFLTDKALSLSAGQVFFSKNQFVITPDLPPDDDSYNEPWNYPNLERALDWEFPRDEYDQVLDLCERTAEVRSRTPLDWIPALARKQIRRITFEITFGNGTSYERIPRAGSRTSWCYRCAHICSALDYLREYAYLPRLEITIFWTGIGRHSKHHNIDESRIPTHKYKLHPHIVKRLEKLVVAGLGDLFFHIDSLYKQGRHASPEQCENVIVARNKENAWEKRLMGQLYDARARGKTGIAAFIQGQFPECARRRGWI